MMLNLANTHFKFTSDFFIIFLTCMFFLILGCKYPAFNWDIIGYMASAYDIDGLSAPEISKIIYSELKAVVPPEHYAKLIDGHYPYTVYSDPLSLQQQIPLYKIRIFYIQLMRLLHFFGITYSYSSYLISALFASLSALILGLFLKRHHLPVIILPLLMLLSGFKEISTFSTPDAMATFFSLVALYFVSNNKTVTIVICLILPFIRTDYAILSFIIFIFLGHNLKNYFYYLQKKNQKVLP